MLTRELLKTGITGLDDVLGGGILRNSIVTVSGSTGCGKSTFAMQFLVAGATKFKEPGLYITIEESRETLMFHMSGYSWDLEKLEKSKLLMFLDYPIYEVDQFLNQNNAIQEIIQTLGVRRVVIDSVMPLAVYFSNDDERKRGFLKLMENLRKWNATTLIISEDTPATTQDVLPDTKYGIETFSDAWIHIYYLYGGRGKERSRAVEILKLKGMQHSSKIHPASIDNNGFTVNP